MYRNETRLPRSHVPRLTLYHIRLVHPVALHAQDVMQSHVALRTLALPQQRL